VPKKAYSDSSKREAQVVAAKIHDRRYGFNSNPKGSEVKALDGLPGGPGPAVYDFSQTGTVRCLNIIGEGSAMYQRIGRRVTVRSLNFTGSIRRKGDGGSPEAPVVTTQSEFVRVLIVWDMSLNGGALPTVADILRNVNSSDGSAASSSTVVYQGVNLANRNRFKILADWEITLPPSASTTTGTVPDSIFTIKRYIKMYDGPVVYNAPDALVGSIASGALYAVTVGSGMNQGVNGAAATSGYELLAVSRLRYTDN